MNRLRPGFRGPDAFEMTCSICGMVYESLSGRRKRCYDCSACLRCGRQVKRFTNRFCSASCSGKWRYANDPSAREALAAGREHPNRGAGISKARLGQPRIDMRGPLHFNWKGGVSEKHRWRNEKGKLEYKMWRRAVFERDHFTCQACGDKPGKRIHAHHLAPWGEYAEVRYSVDNGLTLCEPCHRDAHASQPVAPQRSAAGSKNRTTTKS
jgi:5-methylcytosine-specific restriction endonuclease McrA